jgi:thiamine-monophosphate kinase
MTKLTKSTTLLDIGEKQLVKLLMKELSASAVIPGGRGNDATALDIGLPDELLLVNIDRCPTPLAFKMDPSNLSVWGDLAITCVASDQLASGANPTAFLTSLLLPRDLLVSKVVEMVQHAESLAHSLEAEIVAGDTKESSELGVIATALGIVKKGRLITRKGARPGDVLVLTGELGSFTATQLAWKLGMSPNEMTPEMLASVLEPRPAVRSARTLLSEIHPNAGMDLSDGLLNALFLLSELNGLGIILDEEAIPISKLAVHLAHRFDILPLRLAFGTGDWQIVYAVDQNEWGKLLHKEEIVRSLHPIAEFTSEPGVRLRSKEGEVVELMRIEQEHFSSASADRGFLDYLLKAPLFR